MQTAGVEETAKNWGTKYVTSIIILWSDCESWGASAPPAPLAQPPLNCLVCIKLTECTFSISVIFCSAPT